MKLFPLHKTVRLYNAEAAIEYYISICWSNDCKTAGIFTKHVPSRVFVLDLAISSIAWNFILAAGRKDGTRNHPVEASSTCVQKLRSKHGGSWLLVYAISRNMLQLAVALDFSQPLFVAFCQVPRRHHDEAGPNHRVANLKVLWGITEIIKWRY